MRIFKYWALSTKPLTIDGGTQIVKFYGGSNESIELALDDANQRLRNIQQKIDTGKTTRPHDYEADIREEIVHSISDSAVITRNRYGALILNTTDVSILDIDGYIHRSLVEVLLRAPKATLPLLRWRLERLKRKGSLQALRGWRLYQTHSGWRLMLNTECLDLRGKSFRRVMSELRVDWLYYMLCQKQQCYRARLTPKPYRMRIPTIRYLWPMPAEITEQARQWTQMYEEKSKAFAVCRFLHAEGMDLSDLPAVQIHDRYCCRLDNLKLA